MYRNVLIVIINHRICLAELSHQLLLSPHDIILCNSLTLLMLN